MTQHLPAGILTVLLVGYFAATLGLIVEAHPDRSHVASGVLALLVLGSAQLLQFRRLLLQSRASWERYGLPALLLVLTYLPFWLFSAAWLAIPGFLAGTTLLVLPGIWRWIGFCSIAAAESVLSTAMRSHVAPVLLDVTITATTGLLIYGLLQLAGLISALQDSHAALVQVEMARERVRLDRDLHDLVGNRLSVIGLKSELARRLLDTDPDRARSQLTEVVDIARGAQADVRALTRGQPTRALRTEIVAARSALESAGAHCRVEISCSDLPGQVAAVLVAVLREGVTNIVRHSTAHACQIEIHEGPDTVRMAIRNDGAIGYGPLFGRGTGIANLQARAAGVGGQVSADVHGDGWFELTAEVARRPGEPAGHPVDHDVGGNC